MASPSTTRHARRARRRPRAAPATRPRSTSTAVTAAPVSASASVSEPSPAPISTTRSPGPTPARRAMRRTVLGSTTKFWPRARRGARPRLVEQLAHRRARVGHRRSGSVDRARRPVDRRISTSIGVARQVGDLAERGRRCRSTSSPCGSVRRRAAPSSTSTDRPLSTLHDRRMWAPASAAAVQARVDAAARRGGRSPSPCRRACRRWWPTAVVRVLGARRAATRPARYAGVDRSPSGRSASVSTRPASARRRQSVAAGRPTAATFGAPDVPTPASLVGAATIAGERERPSAALASTSRRRSRVVEIVSGSLPRSRGRPGRVDPTEGRRTPGRPGGARTQNWRYAGRPVTRSRVRPSRRARTAASAAAQRGVARRPRRGDAVDVGHRGADERHQAGRLGWPRWGTGRQVRAVGLDQQPVERARGRPPSRTSRRALERDDPAESR